MTQYVDESKVSKSVTAAEAALFNKFAADEKIPAKNTYNFLIGEMPGTFDDDFYDFLEEGHFSCDDWINFTDDPSDYGFEVFDDGEFVTVSVSPIALGVLDDQGLSDAIIKHLMPGWYSVMESTYEYKDPITKKEAENRFLAAGFVKYKF